MVEEIPLSEYAHNLGIHPKELYERVEKGQVNFKTRQVSKNCVVAVLEND